MTSQLWRPVWACAQHVWQKGLCAGIVFLLATPIFADTIRTSSYNSWQWNGFSRSSLPTTTSTVSATTVASRAATTALITSTAWDALSSNAAATSLIASALTVSSANTTPSSSGVDYSSWQWNGFSCSTTRTYNASTTTALAVSPLIGNGGSGALSGFVYFDYNKNNYMDSNDWAICDAKISLALAGDSNLLTMYTAKDGSYAFNGLLAGAYTISMMTPVSQPGQDNGNARTILDKDGLVVSVGSATGTIGQNVYGVTLAAGYTGVYFNFAQNVYPVEAISKRLVLNVDPGIINTGNIVPVPEPSSAVLLTIAGLLLGGFALRRWK